jgi:hypothetical protein
VVGIGLGEEAVDHGLKFGDRAKHTTFEAPFGQLGAEAFDGVQP